MIYLGVFILLLTNIFFDISLSIAIAEAVTPECVYGILNCSSIVCIYPSSPNCPWSALKITVGLNFFMFFFKLVLGSDIFTLYPFFFNSLATWIPVSRLIALSLEIPPLIISTFFFQFILIFLFLFLI